MWLCPSSSPFIAIKQNIKLLCNCCLTCCNQKKRDKDAGTYQKKQEANREAGRTKETKIEQEEVANNVEVDSRESAVDYVPRPILSRNKATQNPRRESKRVAWVSDASSD